MCPRPSVIWCLALPASDSKLALVTLILLCCIGLVCDGCLSLPTVSDYVDSMEEKVKPLFSKKESLSDAEIIKLGKKDPEAYPLQGCIQKRGSQTGSYELRGVKPYCHICKLMI